MRASIKTVFPYLMAAFMGAGCQSFPPSASEIKALADKKALAAKEEAEDEARLKDIVAKFKKIEGVAEDVHNLSTLSRRVAAMPDQALSPRTCALFLAATKGDYYEARLDEFETISRDITANPLLEKFPKDGQVLKEKLNQADIKLRADIISGTITTGVVVERCILLTLFGSGQNRGEGGIPNLAKPREFSI